MSAIVLFNKPFGVLSQFSPSAGRPTLRDFLPARDIYPAGRLDAESEGLLVLTADGGLQHRISDPRHKLPKVYWAEVEGVPDDTALARLGRGVKLPDYTTRPAQVRLSSAPSWLWPRVPPVRFRRHIPTSWLEIVLTEGRNRQVRRMTAAFGFPTLRLVRYAVGEWTIGGLLPGQWRALEVTRLLRDGERAGGWSTNQFLRR
jgi:23S rRNA pseudouridine2457 synthase